MDIFGILALLGGLAMFLYGMNVMGAGLEKMSGGRLERVLEKLTSNPWKAVLLGAGVTAVIQSSSATTVMAVGFVNSGIMKLSQAVGIIMGANVGTTITAWILSLTGIESDSIFLQLLKPSSFAPVLAIIGIIFLMSGKSDRKKNAGEILLGFTVLMYGMEAMSGAVKPLAEVEGFTNLLTFFKNPLVGIIAGALLTAIIQSSSASVGILQALSVTGAFTYSSVVPIILGQNIGTCVTAMLSSIGANKSARRTAFVHLYFNVIGTVIFMILFYAGNAIFSFPFADETVGVAGIAIIHSIFNVFTTLVLLPFTKGLEKLVYLTLPLTEEEKNATDDVFTILDERFLSTPAIAMEQCRSLMAQMAEMTRDSFLDAMGTFTEFSEEKVANVIAKENRIDVYEDKIRAYLTKLNSGNLSYHDSLQVTSLQNCLTDFERISDHAISVAEGAQQMNKKKLEFSKKGREEVDVYSRAVADILERTTTAFISNSDVLARTVEPLDEVIGELSKTIKKHHLKRMRKGKCMVETGPVLSDLAMNYQRAADHCSNIAVYMMQIKDTQLAEHSFTEQMDEVESAEFIRLQTEFRTKYSI